MDNAIAVGAARVLRSHRNEIRIARASMLFRSVIAGVVLGLLCVFAFAVVGHCDLTDGCGEISEISDAIGSVAEKILRSDGVEDVAKTKPIPPAPKAIEKDAVPPEAPIARLASPPRKQMPAIPVESYNPADQYDIREWNLVAFTSGSVDSVRTASGIAFSEGAIAVSSGNYLVLSGWAGHPAYGMRFRDVLFSLCGKVIGRAPIDGGRPDVATAVHRNLMNSGWTAKIAADHLPHCEEQVLQVWGVVPIGYNIFPLTGKTSISYSGPADPAADLFKSQTDILTPAQNGKAVLRKITIKASALRLRKCGDPSCDVVGRIAAGQHDGFVLETVDQWSLFQIGGLVGWASNKYLTIQ